MKTWRKGVDVKLELPSGRVVKGRCLKYPLLRVLLEPPVDVFVRRTVLAVLDRTGETPLSPEERRAGEGWGYASEEEGIVGTPPEGVARDLTGLEDLSGLLEHRLRAASFDAGAEVYDRARPGYAPELWDALAEVVPSRPGLRVLEVGAGTGQATAELQARWRPDLVCLEPGVHLARRLRGKTGASVVELPFEAYRPEAPFDLLVSATAWHWPPARLKYALARAALAPGGHLAVFWNTYAVADPALAADLHALYLRHGIASSSGGPDEASVARRFADRKAEVEAAGGFRLAAARQGRQTLEFPAGRFTDLLRSFSDHASRSGPVLEAFLADVVALLASRGGVVALAVSWDLLVARRES